MDLIKDHIWKILIFINYALALSAVITVLFKKINPTKTLSYIIVLLVFPFVGLVVYYLFGQEYRKSKIFSRKNVLNQTIVKRIQEELKLSKENSKILNDSTEEPAKLVRLLYNSEKSRLTLQNKVVVIKNGDEKFNILFEDLYNAKRHIHLEYFIVKDDETGSKLLDLLCNASKKGIEVRLIYDSVGSDISREYKTKLTASGVQHFPFMPVRFPKFTGKMNYRDHRKIVVIDGKIAYLGGINISDNYVNSINTKFWRDTHLRIEGEAAKPLQILFFTTWDFVSNANIKLTESYFPEYQGSEKTPVQIAASGPDTDWANIMEAIFSAITNAEKYVYITTPYFIPNDEIVTAMQVAAKSGVDVKLIIPKTSDSWIAENATNSYITPLLEANVSVYHYLKGFVHAKTLVVDDNFCTIGTANMDYRSFEINFEVNAFIYDNVISNLLKSHFMEDLEDSTKLTLEAWKNRSRFSKFKEAIARLMAPLL